MKPATVLHLTHTDIRYDCRILKELSSLSEFRDVELFAFSLVLNEGNKISSLQHRCRIKTFDLLSDNVRQLIPRSLAHALKLFELTFRFYFRGLIIKPDIIHCHDTIALIPGFLLSVSLGAHLIYDAHELESNKNGQSYILQMSTFILERICWNRVSLLVSVSQSILDWYEENFSKIDSILILNSPFVKPNLFEYCHSSSYCFFESNYLKNTFSIESSKPVSIYSGLFCPGRGIDFILSTYSNYPDYHIVFLGYGDLESHIRRYQEMFPNIHLHPAVPQEDVVSVVSSADVGLCLIEESISLSDFYALPNKLFEYAFSGVQILGSKLPDLSSVIQRHDLGFTTELEQHDFMSKLALCRSRTIDEKQQIVARLSSLSWDAQAARLKLAYRKLLPM